jgi:hypothetical protein
MPHREQSQTPAAPSQSDRRQVLELYWEIQRGRANWWDREELGRCRQWSAAGVIRPSELPLFLEP